MKGTPVWDVSTWYIIYFFFFLFETAFYNSVFFLVPAFAREIALSGFVIPRHIGAGSVREYHFALLPSSLLVPSGLFEQTYYVIGPWTMTLHHDDSHLSDLPLSCVV